MSKSRGNIVNPDEYIEKYGADTLRLYMMFMGPMDGYPDFRDTGIEGMRKFTERVWELCNRQLTDEKDSKEVTIKLHQTIKYVTEDIQEFGYNTAIAFIMELVNLLRAQKKVSKNSISILMQLLAPFAPHLAEEVYQRFHAGFLELFQKVGITYDLFTSTHTENHFKVSQAMFHALMQRADNRFGRQEIHIRHPHR